MRFELFKEAVATVADLNRQHNPNTYFALNFFADMTKSEKEAYAHDFVPPQEWPPASYRDSQSQAEGANAMPLPPVPAAVDWRTKGVVTPIKNQGQCGSSPYFSAVVSMEGAWALAHHPLISLSEQQIVDCDTLDYGCNGGEMYDAFQTVLKEGGIESEADYPYTSGNGSNGNCMFNGSKIAARFKSYKLVDATDGALVQALTIEPVASAVDASGFYFYTSGVFSWTNCTNVGHGIGVVGYGATAQNVPYYILKNSWGTDWGMNGYMLLSRGNNMCGIASYATYIIA